MADCPDPTGGPIPRGQHRPARTSVRKFGLRGVGCLTCYHRLNGGAKAAARGAARGRPKAIPGAAKWCPKCRRVKPAAVGVWYRNRARHDGLSQYCAVCCRADQHRRDAAGTRPSRSPEARRAYDRARAADPARAESCRERRRRYERTVRGRLCNDRRKALVKLDRTDDPRRRDKVLRRIALLEAELTARGWEPRPRIRRRKALAS